MTRAVDDTELPVEVWSSPFVDTTLLVGTAAVHEDPLPRPGASGARPAPATIRKAAPATIGFEFDLNVGFSTDLFKARAADMPAGSTFPPPYEELTDHVGRDKADQVVDGFKVTRDDMRLEIATVPIAVDDDKAFATVVKNVVASPASWRPPVAG